MSSHEELQKRAEEYIGWEPFEEFRNQASDALKAKDWETLESMFGKRIAFGTAGLRSKMYGGYANMNDCIIIQTSQGLLKYAEKHINDCKNRGIIIGYDGRYHSHRFAHICAQVFAENGWKIYLFNRLVATPLVPFGMLHLNCAIGIVVTASHNPKADNGFKGE